MLNSIFKARAQRSAHKTRIKSHFGGLKSPYASNANRVWRFFRNREKALFCDLVQNLEKDTCLDLGAGSCEYSKMLLNMEAQHSVCVDFNISFMLEVKSPGIEQICCDVELYETDKKYDLILCLGILEFLDHPEDFMIRLKSFLKPTGRIIVLLPLSNSVSFVYALVYLLKGIRIHILTLRKMNRILIQKGFILEKTSVKGLFSGFAVYAIRQKRSDQKSG